MPRPDSVSSKAVMDKKRKHLLNQIKTGEEELLLEPGRKRSSRKKKIRNGFNCLAFIPLSVLNKRKSSNTPGRRGARVGLQLVRELTCRLCRDRRVVFTAHKRAGLRKHIRRIHAGYVGSCTGTQIKGSLCKICQVQIPSGMMVLHKKYYHSKIKELQLRSTTEPTKLKELLLEECAQCDIVINSEMLNLHMKHYHTPDKDIMQPGPGLKSQALRPARKQKILEKQEKTLVRKRLFQPSGEIFVYNEVSKKKKRIVQQPAHSCPLCQSPSLLLTHMRKASCRTKRELVNSQRSKAVRRYIDLVSDEECQLVIGD